MYDDLWLTALAGAAAGLGVAMPLGAIGALLLREGLVNGFRTGAFAAGGVAFVDTLYCAVAMVLGGAAAQAVDAHRGAFLIVSGLLVVAVGVRQLLGALRGAPASTETGEALPAARGRRLFAQFVLLTAVNPITLVYFVALAGAAGRGDGWAGPVVFVAAVGVSSLAWQLGLVVTGAALGRGVRPRTAEVIGMVAAAIVIALGIGVVIAGLRG